jgi:hypothetical protein
LDAVTITHPGDASAVIDNGLEMPEGFGLGQNYPNPFNSITCLTFGLPTTGHVKLAIYDLNGRLLETLINNKRVAGKYFVMWNASQFDSGIYFIRMETSGFSATRKVALVK